MGVTLGIEYGHGPFFVVGIRVSRIERGSLRIIRGVQVDLLGCRCGRLRGHQGVRDGNRLWVRTGLHRWWRTCNRIAGQLHPLHVHQGTVFVELKLAVTAVEH